MSSKNKSVIVFGCDDTGKAKAARFDIGQEADVRRAAGQANFRVGLPKTEQAAAASAKVPEGKLTDKGFTAHPISDDLFSKLVRLLSFEPTWSSTGIIPGNPTASDPDVLKAADAVKSAIKVGSTVLAFEIAEEEVFGWSAAVVLAVKDDQLKLRFRDWAGCKPFTADRGAVALLPPGNGK